MSIKPNDIYELAEKLISESEASNRSAVSRGYYSAYHAVRFSLGSRVPNFSGSQHAGLIDWLTRPRSFSEKQKQILGRQIAILLKAIKAKRGIADYELNSNIDKNFAEEVLLDAKKIIELSDDLA